MGEHAVKTLRTVVIPALPRDLALAQKKGRELLKGFEVAINTSPGLAEATRLGIESAWGEVVVVMDCDDLHPAYMAGILARKLEEEGYDLVKASRINFGRGLRGVLSARGNRLIRRALGLQVSDCTTCFYAGYRYKLLDLPEWVWHGHGDYMMALLSEAQARGWRIAEFKYIAPADRRDGSTSLRKHVPMYLRRIRVIRQEARG